MVYFPQAPGAKHSIRERDDSVNLVFVLDFSLGCLTLRTAMQSNHQVSRREFIASTSALLAASQFALAESTEPGAEMLALEGGKKSVPRPMPKPVRWGDPELQQLGAALK